jgi:hypothetical protein
MLKVAAVLFARAQLAPARVTVATLPDPVTVAVQLVVNEVGPVSGVNAAPVAGTLVPVGYVTVIVLPADNAPVVEGVKPCDQVAVEPALAGVAEKADTAEGVVATVSVPSPW